jgi:hypothetical protein
MLIMDIKIEIVIRSFFLLKKKECKIIMLCSKEMHTYYDKYIDMDKMDFLKYEFGMILLNKSSRVV